MWSKAIFRSIYFFVSVKSRISKSRSKMILIHFYRFLDCYIGKRLNFLDISIIDMWSKFLLDAYNIYDSFSGKMFSKFIYYLKICSLSSILKILAYFGQNLQHNFWHFWIELRIFSLYKIFWTSFSSRLQQTTES